MSKSASAWEFRVRGECRGKQTGSKLLCTHPYEWFLKKKWISRICWGHF